MPRRGRRLPDGCIVLLRSADLVMHAGDLVQLSVLRELEEIGAVIAGHGNVDDPELGSCSPPRHTIAIARVHAGELTFELVSLG